MSTLVSCTDFVKVREALAAVAAQDRLSNVFGLPMTTDVSADAHTTEAENVAPTLSPVICHIRYVDTSGGVSSRLINVRRVVFRDDQGVLLGWCHHRKMPRSFRVDRIQELICVVTGEVFTDPIKFLRQAGVLFDIEDREASALRICRAEVNLLTIVGAADGLFDPDEQDLVVSYVYDRIGSLELDEVVLRRQIACATPDVSAFETAMNIIAHLDVQARRRFDRALRAIVEIDGACSAEEQMFVLELSRAGMGAA